MNIKIFFYFGFKKIIFGTQSSKFTHLPYFHSDYYITFLKS